MRRTWPAIVAAAGITLATAVTAAPAALGLGAGSRRVRVNQVGYPVSGPKVAYVMLARPVSPVSFEITTPYGVAYRGTSTDDVGTWNSAYRAVYQLSFSGLNAPGVYQVKVTSPAAAVSPAFVIGTGAQLYRQLVDNGVRYFTSERDGPDVVPSVLGRQPANLTDENAYVYADPAYDSNDNLLGTLKKIGGPVDVAGGWFDAGGGYEKFAYTASYADALMLIASRDFPGSYPALQPEADFGLQWITKLWNPVLKVLYAQVGIGNGNASNTIQGDYNFWFPPQQEDRMDVSPGGNPGPTAYFVRYRPVFEAAPPGKPVSPDLAGRFAADFALGAQLFAGSDPAQAQHLLSLARGVYAMAKTTDVGQLVTAFPHDYYPASQWKSDMAWGAAEIALADEATGAPARQLSADLATAARWARAYIAQGHPADGDTFNLYDDGAVAEAELLQAMQQAGDRSDRARRAPGRHRRSAADRRGLGQGRPVRARHPARPLGRLAARVRPVHHRRPVPEVRRLQRLRVLRAAAAELRARRERVGQLVRGRRGDGVPALHAERDRQPGWLAHRPRRHPARCHHRRPKQHRQLLRPRHGLRDAGVQRGPFRAVQHSDRRLRGQRGGLALGGTR